MDPLDKLDKSLDNLERALAPLIDKSLPETLEKLELLQKAKLQVLLPYVVNDLVFIYLKTRGINPKTHPVIGELDRVKQYFDKIKNAEDPEKRRFAVDQNAATRFIKHAIKESQATQERAQYGLTQGTHTRFTETTVEGPSQGTAVVPSATEAALAKIQARAAALRQTDTSSEESELEVFTESSPKPRKKMTEKRKGTEGRKVDHETAPRNKRRRGMDPWAGYDENNSGASTPMDALTDMQHHKRAKIDSRPSMDMNGETSQMEKTDVEVEAEPGPDEQKEAEQPNAQMITVASKSKKKKKKSAEVIDVDALSVNASGSQDFSKPKTPQVIDVDALDSSRSGTPVRGKKRKGKKKKSPS